ncbi:adenylate kinase [Marinilabilia salmonicolor]|uniref:adenylate kinase n=1 Tax=Marinilabilia salmonicolor TaxID=989 RepID=UPI00029ADC89|nr:adenylate kinase [Marinilabilia salmonicolor]
MLNVVIFGPPGSGKGTQSEKIIEKYGLTHISTGEILRKEINEGTELGIRAKSLIDNGQLIPDETITEILNKKLDSLTNTKGVIFDGYPRTVDQAVTLKKILNDKGQDVNIMLNLEVEKEELIERLLERGRISGRSDDNLATIEKRILVYEERTAPVIDFYKAEGSYQPIKGSGKIDEIFNRIAVALNKIS